MVTIRGGSKLESHLKELAAKVAKPAVLRVGFLEGATYPDGTKVALVAAAQNFGTRTIPPRPFFTNMVKTKGPAWGGALAKILQANDFDSTKALELMGEGIAGQLRQSIVDTTSPPLAPATIKAKGFEKPLVDTGHMLNSVDWEIEVDGTVIDGGD